MTEANNITRSFDALLAELSGMIVEAREQVAQVANASLTMLYWQIGKRIHRDILGEKWADYGKRIVASLGRQLGWAHFKSMNPIHDPLKCLRWGQ